MINGVSNINPQIKPEHSNKPAKQVSYGNNTKTAAQAMADEILGAMASDREFSKTLPKPDYYKAIAKGARKAGQKIDDLFKGKQS